MAKKVGLITINLLAGTAEFNTQMDSAKAKIRSLTEDVDQASHRLVTGNQAASGFIRVAENGMANNLRAVENFMTRTLGLGPVMQAIFPVVGAIAFAGLVVSLGEKVYDFFKKASEGAQRVNNAFREMIGPMRLSNDELRVSNDRLENEIAKLEGKRQNNLQLMLDDARVSADKLGDSLESNLKSLNKLLKEENVSSFWGFITNKAATSDITDYMKAFAASEGEIVDKGQAKIKDAAERKDKPGVDAATSELATAVIKGRAAAVEYLNKQLEIARGLQADQLAMDKRTGMEGAWNSNTPDQAERIAALRGAVAVARGGTEDVDLTQ